MKKILKYKLLPITSQDIEIPKNSTFLCVKEKFGELYIWCLVDAVYNETETIKIEVFGTGEPIYQDEKTERLYFGTCIMKNGLVWHVFNRIS